MAPFGYSRAGTARRGRIDRPLPRRSPGDADALIARVSGGQGSKVLDQLVRSSPSTAGISAFTAGCGAAMGLRSAAIDIGWRAQNTGRLQRRTTTGRWRRQIMARAHYHTPPSKRMGVFWVLLAGMNWIAPRILP